METNFTPASVCFPSKLGYKKGKNTEMETGIALCPFRFG